MAGTRITLVIAGPEGNGASWQLELADDFQTVFNKVSPVNPPSSSLEFRNNMIHHLADGRAICVAPTIIGVVEELGDD